MTYPLILRPNPLGKLKKFKQEHLEFRTMILIATTKLLLIYQASAQWK